MSARLKTTYWVALRNHRISGRTADVWGGGDFFLMLIDKGIKLEFLLQWNNE